MKKVIMSIAVACSAIVINAATVTWQCTGNFLPGSTTERLNGAIAYLFIGDSTDGIAESILAGTFTGAGALADATTKSTGAVTKAGIGNYSSQDVSLYMVLFDAATITDATHFKVSGVITQTFGTSGNKTYNFTTDIAAKEWQAIPEPTSAMLLVLGIAALALKRKNV